MLQVNTATPMLCGLWQMDCQLTGYCFVGLPITGLSICGIVRLWIVDCGLLDYQSEDCPELENDKKHIALK